MRGVGGLIALAAIAALTGCDGESGAAQRAPEPGPEPPPASSSPAAVGPATTVPYWADGKLHVGTEAFDLDRPQWLLHRSPTIVVAWAYPDTSPAGWSVARLGRDELRLDPLPMASEPQEPVLSADGRLIAWVDELGHTRRVGDRRWLVDYRINVYDVQRDRVVGRYLRTQRLTVTRKCCDTLGRLSASGVTNDGRVALSTSGGWPELWRAGSDPVRLSRRVDIDSVPQWPHGIMYTRDTGNLDEDAAAFARVGAHGRVHTLGWVRSYDGLWNGGGTMFAFTDFEKRTVGVDRIVDGRRHSALLDLPTYNARWSIVGWEDAEHVVAVRQLLYGKSHRLKFARCHAIHATCEYVTDRPKDDTMVMLPWPQ